MSLATTGAAAEAREKAVAKLIEAKALTDDDGTVPAEKDEQFNALMAEFRELDKAAGKVATTEGNVEHMSERMSWYTERATGSPLNFQRTVLDPSLPKSLGEQFVQSQAYKELKESGALTSQNTRFRSDPVIALPHLRNIQGAADDIIQTESGGPGNALVQRVRLPGILALQQRPLTVRSLFPQESMPSGDTIEYAAQTGFDNGAAAVAQATETNNGAKPQSSIAWELRTARAEWIATWMAATRQFLADENQARSLIDNQGRLMIRIEEEDQLVNGNGTSPNISGILDQSGIQTLDLTGEDNLDGVRSARTLVRTGVSRLNADFIILHPLDAEEFDLLKDDFGQYRGGNPIGNFTFDQSIWRLRRVESEAVAEGTAIVGAGAAATVFERQPITVLTADQHSDWFIRNLIVVLFEERLAFPVYFPSAFVDVTFGDWVAS